MGQYGHFLSLNAMLGRASAWCSFRGRRLNEDSCSRALVTMWSALTLEPGKDGSRTRPSSAPADTGLFDLLSPKPCGRRERDGAHVRLYARIDGRLIQPLRSPIFRVAKRRLRILGSRSRSSRRTYVAGRPSSQASAPCFGPSIYRVEFGIDAAKAR